MSVIVAAVRKLFGNPQAPLLKHAWPLEHPVLHQYRVRTSD